jgi:DNA-binding transcriptional LysR family regulator
MLITALETKLNAHLYDVTGPYVLLTDAGRHLLLNWSLFLGQIDSLVETMWKSS